MTSPPTAPARHAPVTLRMVLAIALPMTIAHATTPLIGITDMAVIGQLGSAALIGAVALGALLFDFVGASLNFLRHGTTGLIAQAVGAGDREGEAVALWRALAIAFVLGVAIALLQWPIISAFLAVMDPSGEVADATRTYFAWRVWGSPFMLLNYAILGWLLGLARASTGLALQVLLAVVNIVLSLALVLVAGYGVAGVAIASVAAEVVTFVAGAVIVARSLRTAPRPPWAAVFERLGFTRTLVVNRDILIRSWLLVTAFALFTATGARTGDLTLAANAVLLNVFLLNAHVLDALATAAEQLGGRAVGARDPQGFRDTIRLTLIGGAILSVALALLWLAAGPFFVALMTSAEDVRAAAGDYLAWVALTPVTGMVAFVMDGLFIGATWTTSMRNMMLVSTAIFVAACWLLTPYLGNHGLWLAFNVWLLLRGLTLWALVPFESRRAFP